MAHNKNTSLLPRLPAPWFWYARAPQLAAIAALAVITAIAVFSPDAPWAPDRNTLFAAVIAVSFLALSWSWFVTSHVILPALQQSLEAFTAGVAAIPELSPAARPDKNALFLPSGLENVFHYLADILSSHRQHEQALLEAHDRAEAASKAKDTFIANISHELRTPLNAIIGFCEMMHFSVLNPKQKEYLEYIHSAAQTLLAIINELIDLSAVAQGRLKIARAPFNLYKMLQDAAAGFEKRAKEKDLQFSLHLSSSLPRYFVGDNNKLRQVVTNLLANAVRFTDKGHIRISAEQTGGSDKGGLNVRFVVTDTGIGVPEDRRQEIFDRFTQSDSSLSRKYGGAGLGLSLCKEILDLMDGKIRHEPNLPIGSRFIVEVPLELAQMTGSEPPLPESKKISAPTPLHLLVVEDDESNMALAREFLTRAGCRISAAANGFEAINFLQKECADIILLDISMPVMEGVEAIRHIRQMQVKDSRGRPVFVVAMTANAMHGDEEKYLGCGFDEYLAKPISYSVVTGLISRYNAEAKKHVA